MTSHIQRWGNSLAVRIPKRLADQLRLEPSSAVQLEVVNGQIVMTPIRTPRPALADLLARIKPDHLHAETDWSTPQGQEEW